MAQACDLRAHPPIEKKHKLVNYNPFYFFIFLFGQALSGLDRSWVNPNLVRILLLRHWKLGLRLPDILSETARPVPPKKRVLNSGSQALGSCPEYIPQPYPGCTVAQRHLVGIRVLKNETYFHRILSHIKFKMT